LFKLLYFDLFAFLLYQSKEEFQAMLGTKNPNFNKRKLKNKRQKRDLSGNCRPTDETVKIPKSFDWRKKKIVTRVKNQGQCGSCWAFAATATIESLWAKRTGHKINFSEQDLVNCASTSGCDGDIPDTAFNFAMNKGQARDSQAPYTGSV
jgi:C1A family cysteine protease